MIRTISENLFNTPINNWNEFTDVIISSISLSLIIYAFIIFFTVSIIYITYRFWKFLLPKESYNINLNNISNINELNNIEIKDTNKINKEIIESKSYDYIYYFILTLFIIFWIFIFIKEFL